METLLKHAYAPAGFLPDMLARVQVRYPEIPIVFLDTRSLAEEWTFRYLGAALAEHESEQQSGSAGPGRRTASGLRPRAHPSEGGADGRRLARPRRLLMR